MSPPQKQLIPQLIGYFPKQQRAVPDDFTPTSVDCICSVSECLVPGPPDWIEHWKHNQQFLFDSVETARSVIPPDDSSGYDICEYRALPLQIHDGELHDWDIEPVSPVPLDDTQLEVLGYDIVCRSGDTFDCSPLSCNGLANEHAVNTFCLLETADIAIRLARTLDETKAEPGPYCIVRVARVTGRETQSGPRP